MDQSVDHSAARPVAEPPGASTRDAATPLAARAFTALDGAMLGALALTVAVNITAAVLRAGWVSATLADLLVGAYLGALCLRDVWRPVVARLALFGLVAGVLELATDAAGKRVVHSLIYPAGGPFIWDSPLYMPLSWMLMLAQIGYLAWRLRAVAAPWVAVALTALYAGLYLPFSEELAYPAGWWRYAAAPGLGHTPFYVVLFEALIGASLPLLLAGLERWRWRTAIERGVAAGAWMPAAALASWLMIGR